MGYSGTAGPVPVLTCPPEDWWDPAWLALQSPDVSRTRAGRWDPASSGSAGPAAARRPGPAVLASGPGTTLGLWTSRHLPWLRRSSRRRLALTALSAGLLGAGLLAVTVGTAGLTTAVLSPAHAAALPAKPAPVPAPTGRTALPASLTTTPQTARPVWLSVPALGIAKTCLVNLGLQRNGALQVPSSTAVAGWYTGSPRPGAIGAAVLAGHVDSRSGPGIFFWLRTLRPGDRVYVGRADGTMAVFTVTEVTQVRQEPFPHRRGVRPGARRRAAPDHLRGRLRPVARQLPEQRRGLRPVAG